MKASEADGVDLRVSRAGQGVNFSWCGFQKVPMPFLPMLLVLSLPFCCRVFSARQRAIFMGWVRSNAVAAGRSNCGDVCSLFVASVDRPDQRTSPLFGCSAGDPNKTARHDV